MEALQVEALQVEALQVEALQVEARLQLPAHLMARPLLMVAV